MVTHISELNLEESDPSLATLHVARWYLMSAWGFWEDKVLKAVLFTEGKEIFRVPGAGAPWVRRIRKSSNQKKQ